jgi:hypothetical protein
MAVYAEYSTSTRVTCKPNPADQSGIVTCTATVADTTSSMQAGGTITWTQKSQTADPEIVTFKPTTCGTYDMNGFGGCSVTVICNGYGVTIITAEFSGSCCGFKGSKGTFTLTVYALQ